MVQDDGTRIVREAFHAPPMGRRQAPTLGGAHRANLGDPCEPLTPELTHSEIE